MDTRQNRSTAQTRANTAVRQTVQLLRKCYQNFLLHLILGLSISCILLLCIIGISSVLPSVPDRLYSAVGFLHIPSCDTQQTRQNLSQAVFSHAVYLPMEPIGRYFDLSAADGRTAAPPTAAASDDHLHAKDSTHAEPIEKPLIAEPLPSDTLYETDTVLPQGHIAIRPVDLSGAEQFSDANGGILFSNQTDYTVTAAPYLSADYPIPAMQLPVMSIHDQTMGKTAPLVLILHTHGTEAYAPVGAVSVPRGYTYRSEDITENVVSVGAVLAETLERAGIPVLHCTTMFDADSYTDSYSNAAAYIRQTVSAYPSIAYVFDVHRDALEDADGSMLRPVTRIGAEVCAQVMSVVGTDNAGAYHPDWRENLTVAVQLQKRLNDAYPAFARPINLRSATFNAQYAPGSLLLEIGAAGNSVTEARSAAYQLGLVLTELILDP